TIASGSSTASFKYQDNNAGTPRLSAQASGTDAATQQETITAGAVNKLAFSTVPSGNQTASGTATIGPYQVQEQDSHGNPVTAGSTVTLTLITTSTGTAGQTPLFTTVSGGSSGSTVTIASGSSTTSNFYYSDTKAGTPTLTAHNASITNDATTSPNIVPATENKLVITTQPASTIIAGGTVSLGVTVEDQFGNPITTGNTGSTDTISVALSSQSFAAGTTSVVAANGAASFSGLQINSTAGSPYTVTAGDTARTGGASAISNSLTVNPAAVTQLVASLGAAGGG